MLPHRHTSSLTEMGGGAERERERERDRLTEKVFSLFLLREEERALAPRRKLSLMEGEESRKSDRYYIVAQCSHTVKF